MVSVAENMKKEKQKNGRKKNTKNAFPAENACECWKLNDNCKA